jgi:magnesium chelatase accessory protein
MRRRCRAHWRAASSDAGVPALPDDWPLREHSRVLTAGGLRWHVQCLGRGPAVLLVHGTGAASHTWRGLAPLLARHYTVVAPDLPAHGGTARPADDDQMTLPGMAVGLQALLGTLGVEPALAVGHSAGAAILARMCLDGAIAPRGLVSLNGALLELPGLPRAVFSPLARLLAASPLPRLFAWRARDRSAVERLVASTGSQLDAAGVDLYARLVRDPAHVEGVLTMMARWDLAALEADLPALAVPLLLVVGLQDGTVPPSEGRRLRDRVPRAELVELPGLGHLAHEERPATVAQLLREFARRVEVADAR